MCYNALIELSSSDRLPGAQSIQKMILTLGKGYQLHKSTAGR